MYTDGSRLHEERTVPLRHEISSALRDTCASHYGLEDCQWYVRSDVARSHHLHHLRAGWSHQWCEGHLWPVPAPVLGKRRPITTVKHLASAPLAAIGDTP
jgi:hypothetical protein